MNEVRYAIFFVPPATSALYRFGSSVLGYDSYSGHEISSISGNDINDAEWRQLTAEPRRYGFHATLKAPFGLQGEHSQADLIAEVTRFADGSASLPRIAASIRLLDGFAALVPSEQVPALDLLASRCVRHFDRFRRPLTGPERSRRLAQNLTSRQILHLGRWGYPYVFEDFRFHMTLTGRLPTGRAEAVLGLLHGTLEQQAVPEHIKVDTIALLRQNGIDVPFRVIHAAALRESADSVSRSNFDVLPSASGDGPANLI
jgi:putative phosphonate metabolism protein